MKTLILLGTLISSATFASPKLTVACLGPTEKDARGYLVYLHGFENPQSQSQEEKLNREALTSLASELKLRIALPQGPICPKNRRCWPARDEAAVHATFADITAARKTCFADQDYTLVGFSNGGYYAFKLYKAHQDPRLKTIIASSSSGLWDPAKDKPNALSLFHLLIGSRDITRSDAEAFMKKLKTSDSRATLTIFNGGHRLDLQTLRSLLKADATKP